MCAAAGQELPADGGEWAFPLVGEGINGAEWGRVGGASEAGGGGTQWQLTHLLSLLRVAPAKELAQVQADPLAIGGLQRGDGKNSLSSSKAPDQSPPVYRASLFGTATCCDGENHRLGLLEQPGEGLIVW